MAAFPNIYVHGTLVHTPVVGDFEDTMVQSPTIRSGSDGGYVQTRARFTRVTRRWTVHYEGVCKVNMDTIKAFEDARLGGSESFTWTNPEDGGTYTVRFFEPVRYTPWPNTNFLRWRIEFVLEEV